jgi:integrase
MQSGSNNAYLVEKVGKVSIEVYKGSYRLRYRVDGKRDTLTISGAVTRETKAIALQVAGTLNTDLVLGQYDPTKAKYDRRYHPVVQLRDYNLLDLWEMFKTANAHLYAESSRKTTWKQCDRALSKVPSKALDLKQADLLVPALLEHYADSTVRLIGEQCINPCLTWSLQKRKITDKPSYPFPKQKQSGNSKKIYSPLQIARIIQAFDSNEFQSKYSEHNHSYYARFVEFIALMGRRPEDIIALTWNDIREIDGSMRAIISKAYTAGVLKKTKNETTCIYPLNREMLDCLDRQGKIDNVHNLIFPSRELTYIDLGNFTPRYWNKVIYGLIEKKELPYHIRFYNLRHSRATHLIRNNVDIKTIGSLLETSPEMLSKHYLQGNDSIDLPELF